MYLVYLPCEYASQFDQIGAFLYSTVHLGTDSVNILPPTSLLLHPKMPQDKYLPHFILVRILFSTYQFYNLCSHPTHYTPVSTLDWHYILWLVFFSPQPDINIFM